MHYHIDIITHDIAFIEPVSDIDGSKLVTRRQQVNGQAEQRWGEPPIYWLLSPTR